MDFIYGDPWWLDLICGYKSNTAING